MNNLRKAITMNSPAIRPASSAVFNMALLNVFFPLNTYFIIKSFLDYLFN